MHKEITTQAKQKKDGREEVLKEIRQLENRQKILENKQRNEERKARTCPIFRGRRNWPQNCRNPGTSRKSLVYKGALSEIFNYPRKFSNSGYI